jgi:hypothetical protein
MRERVKTREVGWRGTSPALIKPDLSAGELRISVLTTAELSTGFCSP